MTSTSPMRGDAANRQDVKCTVMKHQRGAQSREQIPAGSNATGKDNGYGRFSSGPGVVVLVDWPQGCLSPLPRPSRPRNLPELRWRLSKLHACPVVNASAVCARTCTYEYVQYSAVQVSLGQGPGLTIRKCMGCCGLDAIYAMRNSVPSSWEMSTNSLRKLLKYYQPHRDEGETAMGDGTHDTGLVTAVAWYGRKSAWHTLDRRRKRAFRMAESGLKGGANRR
ncbi:hypothetical protein V8C44DRAFT_329422 [Trichoderma aethiopicum]